MTDIAHLSWHKSSYSNGAGGNCLEMADANREALVRDSKDPGGPILRFSGGAWGRFVGAVRRSEELH
jgi:Domain of unknown function (DUF397)